ncbi:MAG TPA: hypothetical protein VMD99_01750 [Terriglobales bacterium]|nr:hypothetical protein [Terriglobales bacterium]
MVLRYGLNLKAEYRRFADRLQTGSSCCSLFLEDCMVIYDPVSGSSTGSLSVPSVTGAIVSGSSVFLAWQPTTWPEAPAKWDASLIATVGTIIKESMLDEIDNVISDAGGNLEHRGHVVAIALLCALDAISSYGYGRKNGKQIPPFIRAHFPKEYHPHSKALLKLYRHSMVHSWNLFEASILPGNDPVRSVGGSLIFGLIHLREAMSKAVADYLKKLATNKALQTKTLDRYSKLRASAKA